MAGPPSPDCVSFLESSDMMLRLPSSREVELLLSDHMVDEIGRALEDYTDVNPMSVCPSPRAGSPWSFHGPELVSTSPSSTLPSVNDNQFSWYHVPFPEFGNSKKKQKKVTVVLNSSPLLAQKKNRIEKFNIASSLPGQNGASDLQSKKRTAASKCDEQGSPILPPKPSKKKKTADMGSDGTPNALSSENGLVVQQHATSERSRKSSSTYRGVSLCTKDSRWQARIRIRKEVVYLGRFETEEAAARRYDDAAREHHGDKALLNFITPEDRALGRKSVFEQAGGKSARV